MGILVLLMVVVLCLFAATPPSSVVGQQEAEEELVSSQPVKWERRVSRGKEEAEELVSSQPQKLEGRVIQAKRGPQSVIWVVQLSDLHFSVHHPERAIDFKNIVGPALRMINPSLVLITGDLTDGKSKDLLTMKQNEDEWLEYQNVMEDVIKRSGLDKSIFYDLRGNHDSFGVPVVGGSFDFFSKYSINGQLGRRGNVNSVTIETNDRRHLFVGLDSTMSTGLRGPTNLFGHPTDQLLAELDSQLSQWDFSKDKPVTKVSFGHFPLSFSAPSLSQKSLKDTFLKHSLSAYLCGHLHSRFGRNLKRHHMSSHKLLSSQNLLQLNIHQMPYSSSENCSSLATVPADFWEWEMGDWRKSRAMRLMAIDRGHVSYLDIDFKLGAKKTIVLPTFPLDSRFMSTLALHQKFECQDISPASYGTVRALVFSVSPIISVVARIYDTNPGSPDIVMDSSMTKVSGDMSMGEFYAASWNYKAFEDPSPERYWLQIEAIDAMGRSTFSERSPFSINGLAAKVSWTWKEFFVMGFQWAALYYPILTSTIFMLFLILLVPKLLILSKKHYCYKSFVAKKDLKNALAWILQDLCRVPIVWFGIIGYIIYLISCPWFSGQVFTDSSAERGFMTFMGWAVKSFKDRGKHEYIGSPDVMVVVLPHLHFVVLPAILVLGALVAERSMYKDYVLSRSGKKEDDHGQNTRIHKRDGKSKFHYVRWIRKGLLLVCLAICWRHFMNCRALTKAYEMNPLLHFPVYGLSIPLLLVYTAYVTRRVQ
ncbi:hypothetical protein Tsubulata_030654 [Turnera subulata]|uniref:Calcineurin-like phosphoesterase domain-containing protein n=1 Tax=Turnera subulata TaxID=218843 RepID=A0A9Q0FVH6_9ROSI|nr:hypothetical protein Tsubulata_030654 [Turnera subulata]